MMPLLGICAVLITIAIIFGKQAAQKLILRSLRWGAVAAGCLIVLFACLLWHEQQKEAQLEVAEQQEQAKIEQELRELTPEKVQQIKAFFQLSEYERNQMLEKL